MNRKLVWVISVIVCLLTIVFFSFTPVDDFSSLSSRRKTTIRKDVLQQATQFRDFVLDSLSVVAKSNEVDTGLLHRRFLRGRILFKRFEWAIEYFSGDLAKRLNGPPVEEIVNADLLDPTLVHPVSPSGLQVIEEIIYPRFDLKDKNSLVKEVDLLIKNANNFLDYFSGLPIDDWRFPDAAKLEVFRIITLGITGFDNPLTLKSMSESAVALEGVKDVMKHFGSLRQKKELKKLIDRSIKYLEKNTDFDGFDRAYFITEFANRITTDINNLQTFPIKYNRLLNQDATTIFDKNAINADAFIADLNYGTTVERVELGRKLFFDPSLSGTGTRSCASCHLPDKGFADGLKTNTNLRHPDEHLPRNTPTLLNAALQANQFYDMRALTLEDQANAVIRNPDEMDGDLRLIAERLGKDTSYIRLFRNAYPNTGNKRIDTFDILNALAAFTRGELTKLNSRFDKYMQGDREALNASELNGFNLYMGKAKCATCHYMPLFNGITPPKYIETDAEVIGVPGTLTDSAISQDRGYYNIIGVDSYKSSFKTPTVRNIDKTAPYMHNGVYNTLEEVMDFYNNAGAVGLGIDLPNQTLPEERLNLTKDEIDDIIAFMKSLNSRY